MTKRAFTRQIFGGALGLAALLGFAPGAQAQGGKPVPYWASLSATEARMRVGPSLDYPSNWIYRRRDLPVKVLQVHGLWRKVEDSTGTQGWMHVRLLSDTATAIVTAPTAELRAAPESDAKLLYRAEPGVVGRVADCGKGWCSLDVRGQRGYVRADSLWGAVK
jgi:SH3-like domain-containing protein